MKRILLCALTVLLSAASSISASTLSGDWKLHFPFEQDIVRVEDTPSRTYMMSRSQIVSLSYVDNTRPWSTIHYFDKATGRMELLGRFGNTFGAKAVKMAYNPERKYLMVVYDNNEVDFVYDDGHTVTCTDLAELNNTRVPECGDITFDIEGHRACIATSLGYALFDDDTHTMTEYRDYDRAIQSAVTMGDMMLITYYGHLRYAPLSEPRRSMDDYKVLYSNYIRTLLPLGGNLCGFVQEKDKAWNIATLERKGDIFAPKEVFMGIERCEITRYEDGYFVPMTDFVGFLDKEGVWHRIPKDSADQAATAATHDGKEIWFAARHTGLWSSTLGEDETWTPTHPALAPDAPSPFQVTDMAFHPVYGVLVNPRGQTPIYGNRNLPQTPEMSGYRNGSWTSYGVVRRNPAQANVLYNPTGLAIDPDSPEYVYMGSPRHGMLRVNLEDPEDILHMSGPNDPGKSLPGYVEAFPVMQAWPSVTSTLGAKFDADGNLWSYSFDLDRPGNDGMTALCWTPEARRASKDAASFQPWIRLHVPGVAASGSSRLLPLTHPNNRNLLLFAINTLKDRFVVLDHNGTPDDPSDDRMALVSEMRDHTGGVISNLTEHTRCMYEDPATGMVWIGTDLGPYMFNPRTMFVDPTRARRVLATDPATGTQSLLLDGLAINNIYSDTQGRKWFATMHDGLYCTSTDGSEILAHFTTDNSPIPADNVLTVCENIASGSMMVATAGGLSEFIPALTAGRPARTVAALPAAITPSYRGLVTIEGLIDGEEYFITDSAGEVVRRLGRPAAGCLQWDGHDDSGLPVPTGHYNVAGASGHALSSVRVLR